MQTVNIALFPLELFLLPGEKSHLHIFETQYKQLFADCTSQNSGFGIPYIERGKWAGIGSYVKILDVHDTDANDAVDIEICGTAIFDLAKVFLSPSGKKYPTGHVRWITPSPNPVTESLMHALSAYLKQTQKVVLPEMLATDLTPFDVARLIQLNNTDKVKLAKAGSDPQKEVLLRNRVKLFAKLQDQTKSIREEFFLN